MRYDWVSRVAVVCMRGSTCLGGRGQVPRQGRGKSEGDWTKEKQLT